MYSQKKYKLHKCATTNIIFFKSILSDMHHRKTYTYINFQQKRVSRSVQTVHTNLFAKNCKLHKFATCNSNFKKSRLSDMHYQLTDIQANFEINRPIRYQITAKKKLIPQTTDRRTDKK